MNKKTIHRNFIWVISKWWFYLVIPALFFIPSYTARPIEPDQSAALVIVVLSNALIYSRPFLFPVFKVLLILVLIVLFTYKNKARWLFSSYVAFNLLVVSLFQNMAHTQEYGFALLTGNLIVTLFVTVAWIWEIIIGKNNFKAIKLNAGKWILIFLALTTFWYPINMDSLKPDFKVLYLFTSESGLTFCMLIPIYLTILIIIYPNVNYVTLKVTSLAGFITGILNIIQFFILNSFVWMGILHLPLLITSFYGLILSGRLIRKKVYSNKFHE